MDASTSASASAVRAPDFTAARDEAVKILSGFVRIDTSNPPGNETKGAEYLKAILDREGIPSEIFEMEPGRGNIVARIKGNGKKKPILLMGHIDVVGVEREKWTVDPFGGEVKDGYLYGRGSSDDKGMAARLIEEQVVVGEERGVHRAEMKRHRGRQHQRERERRAGAGLHGRAR